MSSAYFPHINLRAEMGVKTVKCMIADNMGPGGSLDSDLFNHALLIYRNTLDRDTRVSPAQVLFTRKICYTIPVDREWVLTRDIREKALERHH